MSGHIKILGRHYDEVGIIRDWWTKETANIFNEKAECLVAQFEKFKFSEDPTLKVLIFLICSVSF